MLASFIVTFREAIEAALIIGIIAAYIARIGRKYLYRYLAAGIIGAIIASAAVAFAFKLIFGDLGGIAESLFDGMAALTAAIVLTYMIFWMAHYSKQIKAELQEKIDAAITKGQMLGIAALSFFAVFREGVETVLFLGSLAIKSPADTFLGFALGLAAVIILSLFMFKGMHRLDLSKFFMYTSILLILFSAGLIATAVNDLNEAGIIPPVIDHVWNLNPPQNPDGSYPLLHENGLIGSSLKSLFGYHPDPSLTQVVAYISYWAIIGWSVLRTSKVTGKEKSEADIHGN